jgi:acyl carrier protein
VVQTVQFLEDSFGIEVRRADVNAENFRSVRALAEFVVRRRR